MSYQVQPRFYAAPNFLKMGIKYLNLSSFILSFTGVYTSILGVFEEVRGGVEPWLMAHWKADVMFLLSVVELLFLSLELLFLSLAFEVLQGKICQNSLPSGGGGSV